MFNIKMRNRHLRDLSEAFGDISRFKAVQVEFGKTPKDDGSDFEEVHDYVMQNEHAYYVRFNPPRERYHHILPGYVVEEGVRQIKGEDLSTLVTEAIAGLQDGENWRNLPVRLAFNRGITEKEIDEIEKLFNQYSRESGVEVNVIEPIKL